MPLPFEPSSLTVSCVVRGPTQGFVLQLSAVPAPALFSDIIKLTSSDKNMEMSLKTYFVVITIGK